jgi:hypothetical protein
MTTLDPSHNPFHSSSGRHAQAVHQSTDSQLPDTLPTPSDVDAQGHPTASGAIKKGRAEGRKRVKAVVPALPDLRFEQVCFLAEEKGEG